MDKRFLIAVILVMSILPVVHARDVYVYMFWGQGCPHCAAAKPVMIGLANNYSWIHLYLFEVYHNNTNRELWYKLSSVYNTTPHGVPTMFIGDKVFVGYVDRNGSLLFSPEYGAYYGYRNVIVDYIFYCHEHNCSNVLREVTHRINSNNYNFSDLRVVQQETSNKEIVLPIIGKTTDKNLLLLTIGIALLDGFNPCAMWVLTFLLSLLVYTKSRKKMLIIGLVFVFTSALMYFLFMTAWMNFFLLIGYVNILRILIALLAIIAGLINIKDFFFFKKVISLTIPTKYKPLLLSKMKRVVKSTQLSAMIIGTIILAVTANAIEGLCTSGFPAIYTRILTLRHLPTIAYYLYLVLYNIVYVLPYAVIVAIFTLTLGSRRVTIKEVRALKLISGVLMLLLGLILLLNPALLAIK